MQEIIIRTHQVLAACNVLPWFVFVSTHFNVADLFTRELVFEKIAKDLNLSLSN